MEFDDKQMSLFYCTSSGNKTGRKSKQNDQFFQELTTSQLTMLVKKS